MSVMLVGSSGHLLTNIGTLPAELIDFLAGHFDSKAMPFMLVELSIIDQYHTIPA